MLNNCQHCKEELGIVRHGTDKDGDTVYDKNAPILCDTCYGVDCDNYADAIDWQHMHNSLSVANLNRI
jgi:hypothetical protein